MPGMKDVILMLLWCWAFYIKTLTKASCQLKASFFRFDSQFQTTRHWYAAAFVRIKHFGRLWLFFLVSFSSSQMVFICDQMKHNFCGFIFCCMTCRDKRTKSDSRKVWAWINYLFFCEIFGETNVEKRSTSFNIWYILCMTLKYCDIL